MQARSRRHKILEELEQKKQVHIGELAERLQVSSMTIRRDLNRFAEQGIVTLVHGGAVFNEGAAALPSVGAREQRNEREKNTIASFCAGLIKEGNSVYIDAGSTAKAIAEAIAERRNIAVLTHSLPAVNVLANAHGLQLISVPGIYQYDQKAFFGEMTVRTIREFRVDIVFLGASAIDVRLGMMSPNLYDQGVKLALLEMARKKILAVDHTKIGLISFVRACDITALDMIVTDKLADPEFVAQVRRMGVEVVQV